MSKLQKSRFISINVLQNTDTPICLLVLNQLITMQFLRLRNYNPLKIVGNSGTFNEMDTSLTSTNSIERKNS